MSEEKKDVRRIKNPEIMNLESLTKLSATPNDSLTDISDIEIFAESFYKAFNDNCVAIPTILQLFGEIKKLRVSRNREGRKEVLRAHQPRASYNLYHAPFPGDMEQEEEKSHSFWDKLRGK